jgi:hypothetical protein
MSELCRLNVGFVFCVSYVDRAVCACRCIREQVKVKVKSLCLTKHHAMKTYWGSGSISPRLLDLGIGWR